MCSEKIRLPEKDSPPKQCPECQGRGWVDNRCITPDHILLCTYCNGRGTNYMGKECYVCHGTGSIEVRQKDQNPCPLCHGAGVYPVPESMSMKEFAYRPCGRED